MVLCLAVTASAQTAYKFSGGYLDILGDEPLHDFDCTGRSYGYYADVPTDCKVFHVCLPITTEAGEVVETAHYSFFCGNLTVFNQESLTCAYKEEAFPCTEAETLYESSNADFGVVLQAASSLLPRTSPEEGHKFEGRKETEDKFSASNGEVHEEISNPDQN